MTRHEKVPLVIWLQEDILTHSLEERLASGSPQELSESTPGQFSGLNFYVS